MRTVRGIRRECAVPSAHTYDASIPGVGQSPGRGEPGGSNNSHRLIRRGLPYGPTYDPAGPHDGAERGMLFHFINANIENQYEFVLRRWVNDSGIRRGRQEASPTHARSADRHRRKQILESIFVVPQANEARPIEVTGLRNLHYDQSRCLRVPTEHHGPQTYRRARTRSVISIVVKAFADRRYFGGAS